MQVEEDPVRSLVNVVGLVNFDAPFFGVSNRVSMSGVGKVGGIFEASSRYCCDLYESFSGRSGAVVTGANGSESGSDTRKVGAGRAESRVWMAGLAVVSSAAMLYGLKSSSTVRSVATGALVHLVGFWLMCRIRYQDC